MIPRPYDPARGDIVNQLRTWEGDYHYPAGLLTAAADQIEALRARVNDLWETLYGDARHTLDNPDHQPVD